MGLESYPPVRRPRPLFLVAPDHRLRIREPIVAKLVAKILLRQLPAGRMRQSVNELDRVRKPPFGDPARKIFANLIRPKVAVLIPHNKKQRTLVPLWMRDADCRRFGNTGAADGSIFQFDRTNPLATRLDDVLGAVGDLDRPIGMDRSHVAGVEPLVRIDAILVLLEVALDHSGPARL